MTLDIEKLRDGLAALTGMDLENAEAQERDKGNSAIDISFSRSFQARLAAKALEMKLPEFKALPAKDYSLACREVFRFLFKVSDEEESDD